MNDMESIRLEGRYAASEGAVTRVVQMALEEAEGRVETVTEVNVRAVEFLQAFGRPKKVHYWEVTVEGTPTPKRDNAD